LVGNRLIRNEGFHIQNIERKLTLLKCRKK